MKKYSKLITVPAITILIYFFGFKMFFWCLLFSSIAGYMNYMSYKSINKATDITLKIITVLMVIAGLISVFVEWRIDSFYTNTSNGGWSILELLLIPVGLIIWIAFTKKK